MAQLVGALDSDTCDSWAEDGSNPATVKEVFRKNNCVYW